MGDDPTADKDIESEEFCNHDLPLPLPLPISCSMTLLRFGVTSVILV
jgi:ribosomal-protein-alanine N-acetyltransferase